MPTLELTLQLTQDGVSVPGFPIKRRITVDQVTAWDLELASGTSIGLPTGPIGQIQVACFRPLTAPVTVALQTTTIQAGGVVLLFDGITPVVLVQTGGTGTPITVIGAGST